MVSLAYLTFIAGQKDYVVPSGNSSPDNDNRVFNDDLSGDARAHEIRKRTPKIFPFPPLAFFKPGKLGFIKGCMSGAKLYALLAKKIFSGTVAVPVLLKLALHAKLCPTIPIRMLKFIIG